MLQPDIEREKYIPKFPTFRIFPIPTENRIPLYNAISTSRVSLSLLLSLSYLKTQLWNGSNHLRAGSMKFWKILSSLIEETLPEWRDKFLSYKDLKKQLKLIYPKEEEEHRNKRRRLDPESDGPDCAPSREVVDFVMLLEVEIDKFNAFFVDKEEEYVIRLKELQDKIANAEDSDEDLMQIWRTLADFHGEMVFLLNYSALNYIGLVKIMKKYEKRSGALIRLPFIQKVLQEPFYTTDVLNDLVKECQGMLDHLLSNNELASRELAEIRHMESMYMKLTESALRVLKEVRSGSSTVSVFSLPPLQNNAMEWRNLALEEQADE